MRLITFGDSWTAGHGVEELIEFKEVAKPPTFIDKLRNQNSWPRWVSEKLNCVFVNTGVAGYGNDYILKEINESIENNFLNDDDLIIVMLSYPYRYSKKDKYNVIETFWRMELKLKNYKHFYFNSFYPTFKNENFDTKNLPNNFINPNGCVADVLKEYEIKQNFSVWEYGSRSVWNDEKGFWEGDYHPNLLGYKIISEYIYDSIKDII